LDATADPLFAQVHKRLEALGSYPALGAVLSGPLAGYRATVVGHFRIVYKHARRAVQVCYIRDCRRS
jgi:hypothetical protein